MTDQRSESEADERESRLGRIAGFACFAVVFLSFGSILVAASGSTVDRTPESAPNRVEQLLDLHKGATEQTYAVILRGLALLLMVGVSLYLWDVVRRRDPSLRRWMFWTGIIGPPLVAVSTAAGFFVLKDIADTFVASGARNLDRANELIDDSGSLRGVRLLEISSHAVLGAWCAGIAYYAMRVGLLTRFLGVWGIGAGIMTAFLPIGDALFLGWVASIGLLALGYWPGEGRPPAWDAGRAMPWPELGQRAAPSRPANRADED